MSESLLIVSKPFEGVSFGLNFIRDGDRFAHRIFARAASAESNFLLYSSVEGNNADDWPPSPPLQDIHSQEIGERQVIMAVGMAGTSHWSAACTLQESEKKVGFHFDMACRVKDKAGWLGSSYRQAFEDDQNLSDSPLVDFDFSLEAIEVDGGICQVTTQDGEIQFAATLEDDHGKQATSLKSPSQTIRWQYLLEFARKAT